MFKKLSALLCFIFVAMLAIPAFSLLAYKTVTSAPSEQTLEPVVETVPLKSPGTEGAIVSVASTPAQQTQSVKPASAEVVDVDLLVNQLYESANMPKYEMRGVWIATVLNIDMPSGMDKAAFTNWAGEVCQNARERKMNTIVFQVKPTADALYKSTLAPWSPHISGQQGQDPGYDPLQIMVDSAHANGLELHAWINPYRVTMASQKLDTLSKDSPAIMNPSWVIGYNNQFYLNPGLPEVRQYLIDCVAEIVENYDVDAIHMDDYFYPYPVKDIDFPDGDSFKKYGAGFATVADWRRSNVNALVSEINAKIKEIKPYVQYGISPFGVWRNKTTDSSGSDTRAGIENYDSLNADTRQWLKDGSIDYLTPQIYWSRISEAANYSVLIEWWNNEILKYTSKEHGGENAHPVNLYAGLADYKVGTNNDASWEKLNAEISGQITDNYEKSAIRGQMHYNYSSVTSNPLNYFDVVQTNNYRHIALTPSTPWNGYEYAKNASVVAVEFDNAGLLVKIRGDAQCNNTRKFVIYRFDASSQSREYKNENIVAVVYNKDSFAQFLDKGVSKGKGYVYAVKTVSNTGVESNAAVSANVVWY